MRHQHPRFSRATLSAAPNLFKLAAFTAGGLEHSGNNSYDRGD
jgi:hypothetical protein